MSDNFDKNKYLLWSKHKPSLERLINDKESFLNDLTHHKPSDKHFSKIQEDLLNLFDCINESSESQSYDLTFGSFQLFKEAKDISKLLTDTLIERADSYSSLEPTIQQSIVDFESNFNDVEFTQIIDLCEMYQDIIHFDYRIVGEKSNSNELYLDLAKLSFINDKDLAKSYEDLLINALSVDEIEDIKTSLDKNIFQKAKKITSGLNKKYLYSQKVLPLSSPFNKDTLLKLFSHGPITEFEEISNEVDNILNNPSLYTSLKKIIHQETELVNAKINSLKDEPVSLSKKYLQLLTELPSATFGTSNSLYLGRNISSYKLRSQEMNRLVSQKKKELIPLIDNSFKQISSRINSYNSANPQPEQDLQEIEKDLSDLQEYSSNKKIDETLNYVDQLRSLYSTDEKTTPALRLFNFAYTAKSLVQSDELKNYCDFICNDRTKPYFTRLKEAKGMNLANLKGNDMILFKQLHEGIKVYLS